MKRHFSATCQARHCLAIKVTSSSSSQLYTKAVLEQIELQVDDETSCERTGHINAILLLHANPVTASQSSPSTPQAHSYEPNARKRTSHMKRHNLAARQSRNHLPIESFRQNSASKNSSSTSKTKITNEPQC
ncbi:hypothetical protein KC19_12G079100 [Ceratodon purpureus]|uniref:Uncharacterized protein n=1 Tax=Ceratodon purpureus TaxID=3225 RepID=A0A8T0G8D4_CERPU|nr:hypothetical protein KC19_12G079100 [Ceratodon purpureus]